MLFTWSETVAFDPLLLEVIVLLVCLSVYLIRKSDVQSELSSKGLGLRRIKSDRRGVRYKKQLMWNLSILLKEGKRKFSLEGIHLIRFSGGLLWPRDVCTYLINVLTAEEGRMFLLEILLNLYFLLLLLTIYQLERMRKEEADAQRKADDDAKKKIALTNMGSGFSSHLQRVFNYFIWSLSLIQIFVQSHRADSNTLLSFRDWCKERQETDWEGKEEEGFGRENQTTEHWQPHRRPAEVKWSNL